MAVESRHALIVATGLYDDESLQHLKAPARDAEALARVLGDPTRGGCDVLTLVDCPHDRLKQEIELFLQNRDRGDLVLLYFSCHGIKGEDGRLYYAAKDTKRGLPHSTAVPAYFVNDLMKACRSRRQVLLLDCCYSAAFARGMTPKSDGSVGMLEELQGQGRVILTASDELQYAFEDGTLEQGALSVFTSLIVDGLTTGDADLNEDGEIDLDELFTYIELENAERDDPQRPRKWVLEAERTIVISKNPNAPLPVPLLPSASPPEDTLLEAWRTTTTVAATATGSVTRPRVQIGELLVVKFEREPSITWKDPKALVEGAFIESPPAVTPLEPSLEILGSRGRPRRLCTIALDKSYLCIPGSEVGVEWRRDLDVRGKLWGPIKERVVRAFLSECGSQRFLCRLISAKNHNGRGTICVTNGDYDRWLARESIYYKGLENALSQSRLYRKAGTANSSDAELREAVDKLIRSGDLLALVPSAYRNRLGERSYDTDDVLLVLNGLIALRGSVQSASGEPLGT
jgi:hypothetical protein